MVGSPYPKSGRSRGGSGWAVFGLLVAQSTALIGFVVLGDLTQWWIQLPRAVTVGVFAYRVELMAAGVAALLIALGFSYHRRLMRVRTLVVHAGAFALLYMLGYIGPPYVMFRAQQHGAHYVSVAQANTLLSASEPVLVLEVNGDARAFPRAWISQPHVAGDIVGGERVAMTFCSLSNLGIAYSPVVNGRELDLKVMLQLENNLVLFDEHTDQPIQQIYGRLENGAGRMHEYPTQVMAYAAFRAVYPDGRVYFNPATNPLDVAVRWMMSRVVAAQAANTRPVFPTIAHVDPRLAPKARVFGVKWGNQAVALTRDHLKRHGTVSLTLGKQDFVLIYYPDYDTVAAFDPRLAGKRVDVTRIDIHGNTPAGRLKRLPVNSEVYWIIWSNFYPHTKVLS